jgi:hypothetical protein
MTGQSRSSDSTTAAIMLELKDSIEKAFVELHGFHRQDYYQTDEESPLHRRVAIQPPYDETKGDNSGRRRSRRGEFEAIVDVSARPRMLTSSSVDSFSEPLDAHSSASIVQKSLSSLRVTEVAIDPKDFNISQFLKKVVKPRLNSHDLLRQETNAFAPTRPRCNSDAGTTPDSKDSPAVTRQQFIVCDHCRSHGLKCNEAPVCQECMLREIACIHHSCRLSAKSRKDCLRSVCYYVHEDHMPDAQGIHNPADPDWIVLPGKLLEYGSAGHIARMAGTFSAEVQIARAIQTPSRQADAKRRILECVEKNAIDLESIVMTCTCVENERILETVVEHPQETMPLASPSGVVETTAMLSPPDLSAHRPVPPAMNVVSPRAATFRQGFSTPCTTPIVSEFRWDSQSSFGSPSSRVGHLPGLGLDDCSPPKW